jgi:hypothetical protein
MNRHNLPTILGWPIAAFATSCHASQVAMRSAYAARALGKNGVAESRREVGNVIQFARSCRNLIAPRECGFNPDAAKAAGGAGNEPCLLHIDSY